MTKSKAPVEPLRLDELERKSKLVIEATGFGDRVHLSKLDPIYQNDFIHLIRCIKNGTPLPQRFYRRGKDLDVDNALLDYGIMHLHLGGQSSNVLVFLLQFVDLVVLLEINTHYPLTTRPPGMTLHRALGRRAVLEAAKFIGEREALAQNLNSRIRRTLGIERGSK